MTNLGNDVEILESLWHTWWNCKLMYPLWKITWQFLKVSNKKLLLKLKCQSVSHSVVSNSLQLMDCTPPGSSIHGFSRQEYWSGLPFPSPGDLPNPEIKPRSSTMQADSLPTELPGKPIRPGNSVPRNIFQRIKNTRPHKKLYMNVHSSISHNSQNETVQMSTNWWINEQIVYPYNGIFCSHKNKYLIYATT